MSFFKEIKAIIGGFALPSSPVLLSYSRAPEQATATNIYDYPSFHESLLQAFGGRYGACFIILHPFRVFNDDIDDDRPDQATLISWREVMGKVGIETIEQMNAALIAMIELTEEPELKFTEQGRADAAKLERLIDGDDEWELLAEGVFDES